MPSGWYPTVDSGHGLVSIVCTTLFIVVSMTETVSLFVLATNSALAADVHRGRVQADGDRSDRARTGSRCR